MLNKAFMRARTLSSLQQRSFITFNDKNYKIPESLDEMISYLDKKRPVFTLLYFSAKWNPIIPKIEKDYE